MQDVIYDPLSDTITREKIDATYSLCLQKYDVGLMDGGCYVFAKAMADLDDNTEIVVLLRNGNPDHYIAKINSSSPEGESFLLDYDGIYKDEYSAINYYVDESIVPYGTSIDELKIVSIEEAGEVPSEDIIVDDNLSNQMKEVLENITYALKIDAAQLIDTNFLEMQTGQQFEQVTYEIDKNWVVALTYGANEGRDNFSDEDEALLDSFLEKVEKDFPKGSWEFGTEISEGGLDEVSNKRGETVKAILHVPIQKIESSQEMSKESVEEHIDKLKR